MKYFCIVPVVNRFDLLENAVRSVEGQFEEIVIIDNTAGELDKEKHKYADQKIVETGSQGFVPALNWAHHHAINNDYDFYVFMHNDGEAHGDMPSRFIRFVERTIIDSPNWGVVFSHYDVISAFSTKMSRIIGEWGDDEWPNKDQIGSYCVDIDYYRRVRLAGFLILGSGLGNLVTHHGSSTIKSDRKVARISAENHRLARLHCKKKWGDFENGEGFTVPYGTAQERERVYQKSLKPVKATKQPGWEIRRSRSGEYHFRSTPRKFARRIFRVFKFQLWGRYSLPCNASTAIIWNLCDGQRTAYDIAEMLVDEFKIDRETAAQDVLQCIESLEKHLILRQGDPRDQEA